MDIVSGEDTSVKENCKAFDALISQMALDVQITFEDAQWHVAVRRNGETSSAKCNHRGLHAALKGAIDGLTPSVQEGCKGNT